MAEVLRVTGALAEAEPLYKRALAIDEAAQVGPTQSHSPRHPSQGFLMDASVGLPLEV